MFSRCTKLMELNIEELFRQHSEHRQKLLRMESDNAVLDAEVRNLQDRVSYLSGVVDTLVRQTRT